MKEKQIERLEKVLCFWEDNFFLGNYANIILEKNGQENLLQNKKPFQHFQELRTFLAQSFGRPFEGEKFAPTVELIDNFGCVASFPLCLYNWLNCSRRVFHVEKELQMMLSATSLKDIKWSEIKWPFDSFYVTFESPICDDTGVFYDSVLVSKFKGDKTSGIFIFQVYSTKFDNYQPLSNLKKDMLKSQMHSKKWEKVYKFITDWREDNRKMHSFDHWIPQATLEKEFILGYEENRKNTKQLGIAYPSQWHTYQLLMRIVAGLFLYFQTLPLASYEKQTKEKQTRQFKNTTTRRQVISEAEIFAVSCEHILSREEKKLIKRMRNDYPASYIVSHFRIGHWRRPPGKGDDPTCPKTVWVRPTIINPHLLEEGALPQGAKTILQS